MNKLIIASLFALSTLLIVPTTAIADEAQYGTCPTQYGSSTTCPTSEIMVDKLVQNPSTGNYTDNLTINDDKYKIGQDINFKIIVKNTGESTLSNIQVVDILPEFVSFKAGPGKFDSNTHKLTFTIDSLSPLESKEYIVQFVSVDAKGLPADQGVTCLVNKVSAVSGDKSSSDQSQFCIIKEVLPATTKGGLPVEPVQPIIETPSTGVESLALITLIPSAISGILIRRRVK